MDVKPDVGCRLDYIEDAIRVVADVKEMFPFVVNDIAGRSAAPEFMLAIVHILDCASNSICERALEFDELLSEDGMCLEIAEDEIGKTFTSFSQLLSLIECAGTASPKKLDEWVLGGVWNMLKDIHEDLQKGLEAIRDRLKKYEPPMEKAA